MTTAGVWLAILDSLSFHEKNQKQVVWKKWCKMQLSMWSATELSCLEVGWSVTNVADAKATQLARPWDATACGRYAREPDYMPWIPISLLLDL